MRTFVIFLQDTGEVVRTHVTDDAFPIGHEDLPKLMHHRSDKNKLDVIEVAPIAPGECFRVDVKTKTLKKIKPNDAKGAGGCSTIANAVVRPRHVVKTVYTDITTNKEL